MWQRHIYKWGVIQLGFNSHFVFRRSRRILASKFVIAQVCLKHLILVADHKIARKLSNRWHYNSMRHFSTKMARKITKQAEFVVAENPLPKVLIRIIFSNCIFRNILEMGQEETATSEIIMEVASEQVRFPWFSNAYTINKIRSLFIYSYFETKRQNYLSNFDSCRSLIIV